MTRKKTVCLSLIPLLIASITLVSIPPAHASPTTMSLNPAKITIPAVGNKFTMDLNITEVTNMKGFEFKLNYNASILNATIVSSTSISASATKWLPVDESLVFHWDAPPTINRTIGQVWVGCWGFTTYTGSGTVLRINFTATALGNSTLHLFDTEVLDNLAEVIPHDTVDGEVSVIPEFPTFIIMPLLLITSLAAALLGKAFWSKKRKDALIAE